MTDSRAVVEFRIPAAQLAIGDLVNTSPGADDDWQEVVGVYPEPARLGAAAEDMRTLVKALASRYVVVELTDIAPVDSNVYFDEQGVAMAVATDDTEDHPVTDVVSPEDGVRTYLYTKFELVTVRAKS